MKCGGNCGFNIRKRKMSHICNLKPRGTVVSISKFRLDADTNFVLSKFHVPSGNFNELNSIYTVRNFRIKTLTKNRCPRLRKENIPSSMVELWLKIGKTKAFPWSSILYRVYQNLGVIIAPGGYLCWSNHPGGTSPDQARKRDNYSAMWIHWCVQNKSIVINVSKSRYGVN